MVNTNHTSRRHLSRQEIKELVQLKALLQTDNTENKPLEAQVRCLHLELKADAPDEAEQLLAETMPLLISGVNGLATVQAVCHVLSKYWGTFHVTYRRAVYTAQRGQFQEL